jgi:hypothetical protein
MKIYLRINVNITQRNREALLNTAKGVIEVET